MTKTKSYQKPVYLLVALALVLSLGIVAVPMAGTAEAAVINVDDSMTTVQINATIAGAGGTDTVQFAPGTYNLTAPLVVNVTGVILQGDTTTPSDVVINAGTIAAADRNCFQVMVDNVTIRGFRMLNAVYQPGSWVGQQNAGIMVGNDGGTWGGQLMNRTGPIRANNGTFSNNIIDNCGIGIYLYESGGHTISNNTITNATIENYANAGIGIELFSEHAGYLNMNDIQILNNIIAGSARLGINTWQEVDYATADIDLTGVVIDGNQLYNNSGHGAIGLWLAAGTPRISCNDIHDNANGITSAGSDLGAGHVVNFNNIYSNTGSGIEMDYFGEWPHADTYTMQAENNWWGDASGPSGQGPGTGDAVSTKVDYTPWLGAEVVGCECEFVEDDTLDAKDEADTEVAVDGSANVTAAEYGSDPEADLWCEFDKYIDVSIDDDANVTEIEIRLYYTDAEIEGLVESSLRLY